MISPRRPAIIVAAELQIRDPADHAAFLKDLLVYVGAGIVTAAGREEAALAAYRLADALVASGGGK